MEKEYIRDLYRHHSGHIISMAKTSGISRATLYRKVGDLGLKPRGSGFPKKGLDLPQGI